MDGSIGFIFVNCFRTFPVQEILIRSLHHQIERSEDAVWEKGFNFDDRRLMKGHWRNEPNPDVCLV